MRRLRAYLDRQVCRHPPSSCPKSNRAQGRRNSLFARWRCGRNRTAVETRGRGICSNRRYRSASPVSSALSPALPVRDKDLGSERHLLAEIPLNQPAGKRETTVAGCVHQRHAAAPVSGPRAKAFLHPKRHLIPCLAYPQTSRGAACRNLEHYKCADHGTMLRFLHKPVFDSQFDIP